MPIDERLIAATEPLARALRPPEDIRRAHLVDQAIDAQGRLKHVPDALTVRSPDGSIWKARMSDAGVLGPWTKVTP